MASKPVTLYSVDLETLRRSKLVTFTLKDGVAVGKWAPNSKRVRVWLEQQGVGGVDGFFFPKDGSKFLKALELGVRHSSTMAIEKG
ncbi:MAG: hypothetical protein ACTSX8_04585 [Alphaproteobacteria bacterium]